MMPKKLLAFLLLVISGLFALPVHALLIGGPDIITAPASAIDDSPGAENNHQQAFNEAQDYLLTSALLVDAGTISAGTLVDSHMIFLNTSGTTFAEDLNVDWFFDGIILGVMSDVGGTLEAASSSFLGAPGTIYPSAFPNRGLESNDDYVVSGNSITVSMRVTEPGDWIRVVTQGSAPIPEPGTLLLLGSGLVGLAGYGRRRRRK